MERRICLRGRTDFPVLLASGYREHRGRGVEISSSGIIVDRGLWLEGTDQPLTMRLTIRLPERRRPISALARHVRCFGSQQVLRFVQISDVDRLTLAEHLDIVQRRGACLN
jgi:hypothetical protein